MPGDFGANSTCWGRVYAVRKVEISSRALCLCVAGHEL